MTLLRPAVIAAALALAVVAATSAGAAPAATPFVLSSPAFKTGGLLPEKVTCDGAGSRPALRWKGAPKGTAAFALIVDDPEAGLTNFLRPDESVDAPFVHWVAWGIKGTATSLTGRAPVEGKNGEGTRGWSVPCPQDGRHTYRFFLLALKEQVTLKPGSDRAALEAATRGKVLATAKLTARYG